MPPFWENWIFWLYLSLWLPYAAFVVLYGLRSPWWKSAIGRGLMGMAASIVAVLTNVLLALAIEPYPWRRPVAIVLIAGAGMVGWYMLGNLVRLQRQERHPPPGTRQNTGDAHL